MSNVVRVFISSPADVAPERWRAEQVAARLSGLFDGLRIETYRWEEGRYFSAHAGFQEQIPDVERFDVVVGLFWSRLGSPLPPGFPSMPDGRSYPSGTAFEVLRAIEHRREPGASLPDVLVYRKTAPPPVSVENAQTRAAQVAALDALDAFVAEWFFNPTDGFKAAFTPFRDADEYAELFEAHLRAWLHDNRRVGRERVWRVEERGTPFRGLAAFDARHREVFFGRRADVERARERLEARAEGGCGFLLIEGASGTGKSSLARAGLLPRLAERDADLKAATLTPTSDPLRALAEALYAPGAVPELADGDFPTPADLAAHLATGGGVTPILRALDRVGEAFRERDGRATAPVVRLALLVDQMESLFAGSTDATERARFAAALEALARSGRVLAVATLRADGRAAALAEPALAGLIDAGAGLALAPPGPEALAEIVRGPAEAAALAFERRVEDGLGLDEVLIRDAGGTEALPLLQFVLDRLYEAAVARVRADGRRLGDVAADEPVATLSFADYDGLVQAVEQTAEKVFIGLPKPAQAAFPRLVRALTEPGPSGVPVLRTAPAAEVAPDAPARALAAALVDARVLTRDGETLRFSHESALKGWARAARAAEEAATFLRVRSDVARQRARWMAEGRRRSLLIPAGVPLAEAEAMLRAHGEEFAASRDFIRRSRARARLGQTALAAAAVVFAMVAAGAFLSFQRAEVNAALANAAQAEAEENAAAAEAERNRAEEAAAEAAANAALAEAERDRAEVNAAAAGAAAEEAAVERDRAEAGEAAAEAARADAEAALREATQAANTLVFELAQEFKNRGLPSAVTRVILHRARALQDALAKRFPDDAILQRSRSAALTEAGDMLALQGDAVAALEAYEEGLAIDRALVANNPDRADWISDVSLSLSRIADMRMRAGDATGALAVLQEGLALRRVLVERDPDNLFWVRDYSISLSRIADVRQAAGDITNALAAYEEGLTIFRTLLDRNPTNLDWQQDVSVSLRRIGDMRLRGGDVAGSEAAFEEALEIDRLLVERDPQNTNWMQGLSIGLGRLGMVQQRAGNIPGALAAYEESLTTARRLASFDPDNTEWARGVSVSLGRLGDIRELMGDVVGALAAFKEALKIDRSLAERDPDNTTWARDVAISLGRLGDVRLRAGDTADARTAFEEALGIARSLADRNPGNADWARGVSVALGRLGDFRTRTGDAAGALAAYEEGIAIVRASAARDPDDTEWARHESVMLTRIGDALLSAGDTAGALATYDEALAIARSLADRDPGNADWARGVAIDLGRLGDIRLRAGDTAGSRAAYEEALGIARSLAEHDSENAEVTRGVSIALEKVGDISLRSGDAVGALEAYEEAVAIARALAARAPENTEWARDVSLVLNVVGDVRLRLGDTADAFTAYKEGLAIRRALAVQASDDDKRAADVVFSLFKVASASDGEVRRSALEEALERVLALEARGSLSADQSHWPELIRAALAETPEP